MKMEDLEMTREEAERLGEALKQEEFQKLLKEYFDEVTDPVNKKKYQEEVTQLEKERGFDVTFIDPEPGYVMKTSVDGEKKAFINICKCDKLGEPTSTPGSSSRTEGRNWSIPYSLLKPREDLDKNGKRCLVFDVVFHPDTHRLAASNVHFRNVVNTTALDAIENNLNVKLDRQNIKFPKLGYKGVPMPSIIRKKSDCPPVKTEDGFDISAFAPPINNSWFSQNTKSSTTEKSDDKNIDETKSNYTIPKYVIKHRSPVDIQNYTNERFAPLTVSLPKELVVEINLPLLNSTETVILDVMEKSVSLLCEKPVKYKLDLILPYTINEDAGNAKFDKSTRKLTLTLPLKFRHDSSRECEDSGVESDLGARTPELSSGDDDSIECGTTSKKPVDNNLPFLSPDKHYSSPRFICDINENIIRFTLQIKNVDPISVVHTFLVGKSSGVHIRFTSMGSGYFPIHYAFCVKFPSDVKISEDSFQIETLDNFVTMDLQFESNSKLNEYFVGVSENDLERIFVTTPHEVPELENACVSSIKNNTEVEETDEEANPKLEKKNIVSSSVVISSVKQRTLTRTVSESSGEDFSLSPRKGILKRSCRSMSESSVDDFLFSSSFEMISEEDDGNRNKKSVRFNDVISQKVYRTNSSILGQRKKNLRKIRNKKKAQENRRASESEASDWEEKEGKNSDENGNEKTDSSDGESQDRSDLQNSADVLPQTQNGEKVKVDAVTDMMFHLDI